MEQIKANELRIGNYLNKACGVGFFEVTLEDLQHIESGSKCKPIPLTEEWLLKFGFEEVESENGDYFIKEDFLLKILDTHFVCIYKSAMVSDELKFVHKLQNLHFELENEELTIKK